MTKRSTITIALLMCVTTGWWVSRVDSAPNAQTAGEGSDINDAVQCANLIYAGTQSSVCFSDAFLSMVAQKTTVHTAQKFTSVKLAGDEIFRFPFAVMTGEGSFVLTQDERNNLRRYLQRGGFLLASAGCSSTQWDASFRREMQLLFPDNKLEPLSLDHDMFRTVFDVTELKTKREHATLQGLRRGDKIVAIYSADGLNDTAAMQGCCCCGGNEIVNAQQINANIFVYSLLE